MPVVQTALGFLFMLAVLVGVQLLVAVVARRALGPSSRAIPATAGLAGYLVCAGLILAGTLGIGRQEMTLRVRVLPASPASEAGLRDGDTVVFVDGAHPTTWSDLRAAIDANPGGPVEVEVQRGAETLRFDVQPRGGRLGLMSVIERHDLPLGHAAASALTAPPDAIARQIGTMLATMLAPMSARTILRGPVAAVAPDPSPWPRVLRLGELGSLAWPLAMLICFLRAFRSGSPRALTPDVG
jgi:membrane-associated protease RseP (regulator of RpoE activity)